MSRHDRVVNLDERSATAATGLPGDLLEHRCRIRDGAGGLISPSWCLRDFASVLLQLPADLTEDAVVRPELRLYGDGNGLEVYYTPFELVNTDARVVLVGITPGRHQMFLAVREVAAALRAGASAVEALQRANGVASFAGGMRSNLVRMLDGIGLADALGIASAASLFDEHQHLAATTSAITHAVFVNGENYTGHRPPIDEPAILRAFITQVLAGQLAAAPDALVIPLGKAASTAVQMCVDAGALDASRCLLDFPNPSGSNGHRVRHYEQRRDAMTATVADWFGADAQRPEAIASVPVPAQPKAGAASVSRPSLDALAAMLTSRATGHDAPLLAFGDDGTAVVRAVLKSHSTRPGEAFAAAAELVADIRGLGFTPLAGELVGACNGIPRSGAHPMWWFGVVHLRLRRR